MNKTIKLHFGKGIKFESEYVEVRSAQKTKDHLLYVNSNNQIQLLGPGNHQQNLVYRGDGFTWEDSNNIDMSLDWKVALDRDQYKTLDGNASPVDSIQDAWRYFYLNCVSPDVIDFTISGNADWIIARPNDKIELTVYPNWTSLAEAAGEFYFEWMNGEVLNIEDYDVSVINQNTVNNESDSVIPANISYDSANDHISFDATDDNQFGTLLLNSINSFSTSIKNKDQKIKEEDLLNTFIETLSDKLMTIALYDPIGVVSELKRVFSEKGIQLL